MIDRLDQSPNMRLNHESDFMLQQIRRAVQYTVVPPAAQPDPIGSFSAVAVAPAITAVKTVEKNIVVPAPPPFVPTRGAQANVNTNVAATVGERLYPSLKFLERDTILNRSVTELVGRTQVAFCSYRLNSSILNL